MVRDYGAYTRKLVLENGEEFYGYGFGSPSDAIHEIVFNTSMVGYQEIVTDPCYTNQIVVMTYPLIGNYGITDEDNETQKPTMGGIIVREYNDAPSNFRYTKTLSEMLEENGIPGIGGIDTRKLTRIIRDEGSQMAMITDASTPKEEALRALRAYELPGDAIARVSCKKKWYSRTANPKFNVVAVDCGIKLSIIRKLNECSVNVTVVPYDTPAEEILRLKPDGLLISNGPGNPGSETAAPVTQTICALRGKLPMFGIGLGHQLIALAYGARVYKMKFGHHGNPPVRNASNGLIESTSQNHSYAVDEASALAAGLAVTYKNVLDDTVEGVECARDSVFAVQYNPESAPGPRDSAYLFDQFIGKMTEWRNLNAQAN